jgi:hypothetical protein
MFGLCGGQAAIVEKPGVEARQRDAAAPPCLPEPQKGGKGQAISVWVQDT